MTHMTHMTCMHPPPHVTATMDGQVYAVKMINVKKAEKNGVQLAALKREVHTQTHTHTHTHLLMRLNECIYLGNLSLSLSLTHTLTHTHTHTHTHTVSLSHTCTGAHADAPE
jgi:hypothetical protein